MWWAIPRRDEFAGGALRAREIRRDVESASVFLRRVTADPYEEPVTEPLPLDRSQPLRGRDLRHACLVVLARSPALTIAELQRELAAAGFTVAGDDPHKVLSDRLRYEVGRGRIRRVGWGRYATAESLRLGMADATTLEQGRLAPGPSGVSEQLLSRRWRPTSWSTAAATAAGATRRSRGCCVPRATGLRADADRAGRPVAPRSVPASTSTRTSRRREPAPLRGPAPT